MIVIPSVSCSRLKSLCRQLVAANSKIDAIEHFPNYLCLLL